MKPDRTVGAGGAGSAEEGGAPSQRSPAKPSRFSSKLSVAEEEDPSCRRSDKLSGHMEKIEKAQKELEINTEEARLQEASLTERRWRATRKRKDEEMEERCSKKIQEHQEKISW